MNKLKKIFFIFFFILLFSQSLNSQDITHLFDLAEKYISKNNKDKAVSQLNEIIKLAQEDTVSLIKAYDLLIKIFKNDTTSSVNSFYLQKIVLLRNFSATNKENDTIYKYKLYQTYVDYADYLIKQKSYYNAVDLLLRALFIAENLNKKYEQVKIYIKLSGIYSLNNDYQKAIVSLENAQKVADTNKIWRMKIFYQMALIQEKNLYYSDAITNYFNAFYIAETLKNDEYRSLINKKIADIFYDLGDYSQSLKYYLVSADIKNNDTLGQVDLYILIGENYLKLGKPIEALNYGLKANTYLSSLKDYGLAARIKILLARIYLQLNNIEEVKDAVQKGLLLSIKANDVKLIIEANWVAGEYYAHISDDNMALFYMQKALKLAEQNKYYGLISEISLSIYEFYKGKDAAKALSYMEKAWEAQKIVDEMRSSLLANKIGVEEEYGKNEKIFEQKVENLKLQKEKLRFYLTALIIVFVLFLLFLLFFIQKLWLIRRQKNLIEKQKSIILKQYEKHKLLSFVASHTDNSIFIMDTSGKVIWVNEALLKLYKTTRYEVFEKFKGDYRKLTHYDADKVFQACLRERRSITYLTEVLVGDEKIWVQTTVSPIIENNTVAKMIGIETDITELKKAEEQLQKQKKDIEFKTKLLEIYNRELKQQKEAIITQNEELQQQQEELKAHMQLLEEYNKELKRLSTIVEESDNIIFTFDLTGKFVWANDAFTKHTGYSLSEFIEKYGDNITDMSSQDDISYYFYTCIEKKRPVKYISKVITKYGKEMWFQSTLTPILDKDNNVIEVVIIDSDITEMKKAEEKIYNQNIEIKNSLEYASKIQKAVLPARIFVNAVFTKNAIFNRPKDFVSGDFYFVHYSNDKAVLVVADSTGHGIPGAFMSLLGTMALRIVMYKTKFYNPNIILNLLNDELVKLLHQYETKRETIDSIDIALCIFDFKKNTVDYTGANIPLYLHRKGSDEIIRVSPNKITIGSNVVNEPFSIHSFTLNEGDRIYLSSDGIADQFGGKSNKKLKRKGFIKLLKELNNYPIDKVEVEIERFIDRWMGANEQVDDMILFVVEY